jgi:hypothetical protein
MNSEYCTTLSSVVSICDEKYFIIQCGCGYTEMTCIFFKDLLPYTV